MTTATTPELVLDGLRFPEGNRWHDGALWFSDMHTGHVARLDLVNGSAPEHLHTVTEQPSGLGWLPNGDLIISSMFDRKVLRRSSDGQVSVFADLSTLSPFPINDLVVDAQTGTTYVGAFGYDLYGGSDKAPGPLLRLDASGAARVAAEGFDFPNGSVVIPDTRTLVVGETWGGRLTALDIADDGRLVNRRTWAELEPGITPDGSCVDLEGGIWIASLETSEFQRVLEGGRVTHRIPVPERHAVDCVLGGAEGTTLFLSSADSYTPEVTARTWQGRIEAVQVDIPGPLS